VRCFSAVLVAVGLALAGCSDDQPDPPLALVNGTSVRVVPVTLEGIDQPALLTSVSVVDSGELDAGSPAADCVRRRFGKTRAAGPIVVRVAVSAESVTFREASGIATAGCVDTAGRRPDDRRWCGAAYGTLSSGRLRDPRLDLGCVTAEEEPVASIWVEPSPDTQYVVVLQRGYAEVYEPAGDLPVRVSSTSGVDLSRSQAMFDLREHDAAGGLLRRYRVEASVAG
jgi:hypothetical protein